MSFWVQRSIRKFYRRKEDFNNPHKFNLDIGDCSPLNENIHLFNSESDPIHLIIDDIETGNYNGSDFSINYKSKLLNLFNKRINKS